jgi:hypothetical protein
VLAIIANLGSRLVRLSGAVGGGAHAIAAWHPSPDTMLVHHPLDPLAADSLDVGMQVGMDARRTVSC